MNKTQFDIVQKTLENISKLEDKIPQAMQNFSELNKAALQDGHFNKRTKEIIALAISIALYSKGCMKYHLQSLIKQALTSDELMEIIAIVTYMCGGTGLMSSAKALRYFEAMQQTDTDSCSQSSSSETTKKDDKHMDFRDNVTKGYD